ncbi:MAG TPA: succinate dehydrogenase, cytochrome b556 subunit [Solimonas sp.]|nr:succinate dehydrogenase, cytochrome b556 subunit [Solimonas sp.]
MADPSKTRPEFRNIHPTDLRTYRWPAASLVSGMHRISGLLMFLLLPFVIWLFDKSVSSEISYETFTGAFVAGIGVVPAWFVKLVVLGLIWAYLHHLIAGLRHLWMDVSHQVSKESGQSSSMVTFGLVVPLTLALGAKLFGLY